MRSALATLGRVVFWLALILCALIDFRNTMLFCGIIIGIGLGVAFATAADTALVRAAGPAARQSQPH
jgi:hypothetical protein